MPSKITGNFSITNYYDSQGNNETLNLVGINIPLWKGGSLSGGVGRDVKYSNKTGGSVTKPALEVKYKQNVGNYTNLQLRFREIDGTEQYRVAFGANYQIDKNWSTYGSAHVTAKNNGNWSYNTGAYFGGSYKDTKTGISIFAELQQNVPLNHNINIGKTLASFDDGNKLFNVGISIPLK